MREHNIYDANNDFDYDDVVDNCMALVHKVKKMKELESAIKFNSGSSYGNCWWIRKAYALLSTKIGGTKYIIDTGKRSH